MTNFLERFREIVSAIASHPLLEIVQYHINPPASNEVLVDVEKKIGASLAESIRAFYQEANGFKLHWKVRTGLSDEELNRLEDLYDDYGIGEPDDEDNESPFACINLIPIEECMIERDWHNVIIFDEVVSNKTSISFSGVSYEEQNFRERLRPFDLFSNYSCMAFLLEDGIGDPKVLHLSDYYVEWDSSRVTDFESYLEMLCATRGIVESRENIYGHYSGHSKRVLITGSDYWTRKRIPKLFR